MIKKYFCKENLRHKILDLKCHLNVSDNDFIGLSCVTLDTNSLRHGLIKHQIWNT